jgi:hypothetical protein
MIVSLGLLPNLLPGIGLAPDKRSNFLQAVFQVNKYGVMERLDQGHLYPKQEASGLACPGRESNPDLYGGRRAL